MERLVEGLQQGRALGAGEGHPEEARGRRRQREHGDCPEPGTGAQPRARGEEGRAQSREVRQVSVGGPVDGGRGRRLLGRMPGEEDAVLGGEHEVALHGVGGRRRQSEVGEALGPDDLDARNGAKALAQPVHRPARRPVERVHVGGAAVARGPGAPTRDPPGRIHLEEALLAEDVVEVVGVADLREAVVAEDQQRRGLGAAQLQERREQPADERVHLDERPARLGALDAVVVLKGVEGEEVEQQEARGPHGENVAGRLEGKPVLHGAERVCRAPRPVAVDGEPLLRELGPEWARGVLLEQLLLVELGDVVGDRRHPARLGPADAGGALAARVQPVPQGLGADAHRGAIAEVLDQGARRPVEGHVADDPVPRRAHAGHDGGVAGPGDGGEDGLEAPGAGATRREPAQRRQRQRRVVQGARGEPVDGEHDHEGGGGHRQAL